MHPGRHRHGGRPRSRAAVRAIRPTVRFLDRTDHACPNAFAESSVSLAAMSLIAHLRRHLVLAGHFGQSPRLGNVVAERFLTVDADAQLHGDHGRRGVLMVRRGDEYCVELLGGLVEQAAVIAEAFEPLGIAASSLEC